MDSLATVTPANSSLDIVKEEGQKDKDKVVSETGKDVECNVGGCSAPGNKSCSACHLVNYCSPEHQKKDWSAHKKNCSAYVLKENSEFGRHLVATRKLKAGTLILEESPSFCAPRGLVDEFDTPICLSCCVIMEGERASFRCSKCNWPTCCWTCETHKYHSENECPIFVEKKIKYPPPGNYALYVTYKAIEIMRGVLIQKKDPDLWTKLMNLQHTTELGKKRQLFEDLPKLRKTFGVEDLGTEDDWHRILGILNVNNLSMEGKRGYDSPSFTGFLFLNASMFTHSCSPNCWWGVSAFPIDKIHVRTTVDVQKGDVLSIPYSFLYNGFGTHKRQELIQDDGEFICRCNRCSDPTELSSYTAALICLQCTGQNLLPLNPLDLESDWKCEGCGFNCGVSEINTRMEDLMAKLEACETIPDMETFMNENRNKTVHRNHWLITEAENVICKERARSSLESEELTVEVQDERIKYCSHQLAVKSLVAPGLSLERGRLLNHLARAKLEKLEHLWRHRKLTDPTEITAEVLVIYSLYDEAFQFYKNDPTETAVTEKLGLKARTIMSDMQFVENRFINPPDPIPTSSEAP